MFLLLGLFLLYGTYSFAFTFGASFDDEWNLSGLSRVTDFPTAVEFVLGGSSGPLGRPIALLSFLPRAASWPSATADFLRDNALIHLLNVTLVCGLVARFANKLPWRIHSPSWFAVVVALWWGGSPLLLSASAMIVQRMTTLSASFTLLGLIVYLIGRARLRDHPVTAMGLMSIGLAGGSLLGVLSKETGALLPGFVLILETTLLSDPGPERVRTTTWLWFSRWKACFLVVPTLLVLIYLIARLPEFELGYRSRNFDLESRVMTEARVLLAYLKLLFLPVGSQLGPYHDGLLVSEGLAQPPTTAPALIAIGAAVVTAWRCRRGPWRLFSFAVAWFLWGHILESTVVPLELYFEHRNYLPALGPIVACAALLCHPKVHTTARLVLLSLVLGSSMFVLREEAQVWGDRRLAAASWHAHNPDSLRAFQLYLITLYERGETTEYWRVIESAPPNIRDSAEHSMIRLAAACNLDREADVIQSLAIARSRLATMSFNATVTDLLDKLVDVADNNACPGLKVADMHSLLNAVHGNPNSGLRGDVIAQAHEIHARLTIAERDLNASMIHLEEAYRLRPTTSVGISMAALLVSAQLYDEALRKVDELAPLEPALPVVRQRWLRTVDEMRSIIIEERRLQQHE